VVKSKALALTEVATRALQTAVPVIAVVAIYYALMLAILNFMQALGHRFEAVASGVGHITHFTHLTTWEGPAVIPALLGVCMLVLVYELWLRKRMALVVLCGFIIAQAFVDASRGMRRPGLILTLLLAMVLAASFKAFPGRTDPAATSKLKIALPVIAGGFFVYGITGLYLLRGSLGIHTTNLYGLAYKSVAVAVGNSGFTFHGLALAFRCSMIFLALGSIILLAYLVFRPYREEGGASAADRERARNIVENYGSDSLAYFNLRSDKQNFFHGDSFLAYKVVGDVAVISGDPVGPADNIPEIVVAFREYCLERGWRLSILGASGTLMPYYEEAGLRGWELGEETVVNVEDFSLEGRQVRKLRQSVNKLAKAGYTMEFMYNASIPAHMKHELVNISVDWRGGKQETGFSMGLGRLMSSEDPDCLFCVAYDPDNKPVGFLHFVPMYPHVGYSLDVHRSKIGSPGAVSEFMIARTAEFLHSEGYRQMSLHFLALAENYRDDRDGPGSPFYRGVARVLDHILPIVSVYHFDKKFFPAWKKRYLLHVGVVDLLLVGLAAVSAESALGITRPSDRRKKE